MLYLSNNLVKSSPMHASWARQIMAERALFNASETALAKSSGLGNSAALLPQDAWRMIDDVTMRVMRRSWSSGADSDR